MMFRQPRMKEDSTGSLAAGSTNHISVGIEFDKEFLTVHINYQVLPDAMKFFSSPRNMKEHIEKDLKDLLSESVEDNKAYLRTQPRLQLIFLEEKFLEMIILPTLKRADKFFLKSGVEIISYNFSVYCYSYDKKKSDKYQVFKVSSKIDLDAKTQTDDSLELKSLGNHPIMEDVTGSLVAGSVNYITVKIEMKKEFLILVVNYQVLQDAIKFFSSPRKIKEDLQGTLNRLVLTYAEYEKDYLSQGLRWIFKEERFKKIIILPALKSADNIFSERGVEIFNYNFYLEDSFGYTREYSPEYQLFRICSKIEPTKTQSVAFKL